MASWRQQALIEAPLGDVWGLLCDPARAPEWAEDILGVTGGPATIEEGSTYDVTARGPLGLKATTPFKVEEVEDMRSLKMKCQVSGFYSHWVLTEAQGGTFAELELGVEPLEQGRGVRGAAIGALHTKSFLRRATEKALDGLRRGARRFRQASPA